MEIPENQKKANTAAILKQEKKGGSRKLQTNQTNFNNQTVVRTSC